MATTWDPSSQTSESISWKALQETQIVAEVKLGKLHSNSSKVTVLKQNWQKKSCLIIIKRQILLFDHWDLQRPKKKKKKKAKKKNKRKKVTTVIIQVKYV